MAEVIWTQKALDQVEQIGAFIEQDSVVQARRVVRTIIRETRKLMTFPRIGRMIPEMEQDEYRELLVFSYRVLYRLLDSGGVAIMGVVHGRQLFDSDWLQ